MTDITESVTENTEPVTDMTKTPHVAVGILTVLKGYSPTSSHCTARPWRSATCSIVLYAQMDAPPRTGSRSLVVRDRKPFCVKTMLSFQSFEEQSGHPAAEVIAGVSTASHYT